MSKHLIIIAGIPAAGKTYYGRHISEKLQLPFISKDAIKEKLHDALKFDTATRENSQLYGMASYSVFFDIIECLMKANIAIVIESNFTPSSADILLPLIEKYGYTAMTVLFDADIEMLHKRFCERDVTSERHPGLSSTSGIFNDFEFFKKSTLHLRDFKVGEKIVVDTSDFTLVNYDEVDNMVKSFISEKERGK